MKLKKIKSKTICIEDALQKLDTAIHMEDPHIRMRLPWGVSNNEEGKEFLVALKDFIKAYKKYQGLEKVELDISLL